MDYKLIQTKGDHWTSIANNGFICKHMYANSFSRTYAHVCMYAMYCNISIRDCNGSLASQAKAKDTAVAAIVTQSDQKQMI